MTKLDKRPRIRLSKRKDDAAEMSLEIARMMVDKIVKLKSMRRVEIVNKGRAIRKTTMEYEAKITTLEKDIYNIENAIKKLCGASDYTKLHAEINQKRVLDKKQEALNTSNPDNKDNDNNEEDNKTEEVENGQAEMS